MKANDFRLKSLINQANTVRQKIEEASHTPISIIKFDFVFYDEVVKDLENAGWEVYNIKNYDEITGQLICPAGLFDEEEND